MTRLRIEFAPDRRWIVVVAILLLELAIGGGTAAAWHRDAQRLLAENERSAVSVSLKTKELRHEKEQSLALAAHDSNAQQLSRIRARLQFDWNPAFATLENIDLPGVRLMSMSATAGETIRVEYRVSSVAQASELTTLLNAGRPYPVWRLDSVTMGPLVVNSDMQGTWSATLNELH
jgi:hypothetical protein